MGRNKYNRSDLSEGDVCAYCEKPLSAVDEIHVVEGQHFCCAEHAIDYQTWVIIASARETAKAWYRDFGEIVTPSDIGIE